MIGYFVIDNFINDNDGAGFSTKVNVSSAMDMNLKYILFLPPYLRKVSCNISEGDKVFGVADDTSGLGVALCGLDGADFGYFFDTDIQIKQKLTIDKETTINKSLTVTSDIKSTSGDVKAGNISLKNHTHPITVANFSGTIDPTTGAASGQVTGTTDKPTGV